MVNRLKRTTDFNKVYRSGQWAHGSLLSVGALANNQHVLCIGLRVKRGMKDSPTRNRLKRQLRAILRNECHLLNTGLNLVIVIHPKKIPIDFSCLAKELEQLCKRVGAISQVK